MSTTKSVIEPDWSNAILNSAIDLICDTLHAMKPEMTDADRDLIDRVYDRMCERLRY